MHANQIAGLVIGAAAFLAALIYIGRQIGRAVILLTTIAKLPQQFDQLRQATDVNTKAIQGLTRRLDGQENGRRVRGRA